MKLIVGLGNPGRFYLNSRHNIGFLVAQALAGAHKIALKRNVMRFSIVGKGRIKNKPVVLAEPLTFMNLSGLAVSELALRFKTDVEDILVVCDDMDLETGRIKIKASGSSGGHRGLDSVISVLGTNGFARMRIGIGRPGPDLEPSDYVLSPFSKIEKKIIDAAVQRAMDCSFVWVTEGINKSMNIFNPLRKIHGLVSSP